MNIRVLETGKLEKLIIKGINGIEFTYDLLGNHDATTYNEETEEHEMSQDDFKWWEEYINDNEKDAEEITELAEELEIEESEIWDRVNREITNDLGDEHSIKQNIIAEFRVDGLKAEVEKVTGGERVVSLEQLEEVKEMSYTYVENGGTSGTGNGTLYTVYVMDSQGNNTGVEVSELVVSYK